MAIRTQRSEQDGTLIISVEGRFDFSTHQDFRHAYEAQADWPKRYQIDLAGVDYLDSSALGMLLLLRDHAGGDDARIQLSNCRPDVRKVLTISNFEQLFEIV